MPDSVWQPERSLWCAVIGQSATDAASSDGDVREEVEDWLMDEDFSLVCSMAGMQPKNISTVLWGILNEKDRKAAFRKAMTFKIILKNYVASFHGTVDNLRSPLRTMLDLDE